MLVLAHPGGHAAAQGPSTWESMAVLATLSVAVVLVLVALRRLRLDGPSDLLLPLAAVVVVVGLGAQPLRSVVGGWFPWAGPAGLVLAAALVVVASTGRRPLSRQIGPATGVLAVAAALVGSALLGGPAAEPLLTLPVPDDATVELLGTSDGVLDAGRHTFTVRVTGASIGPPVVPPEAIPADPEELGHVRVLLDGAAVPSVQDQNCSPEQPCSEVSFSTTLSRGEHVLDVQLLSAEGFPFSPPVQTRIRLEAL